MDKDGSNQISLTPEHGGPVKEGAGTKPVISPDGTKIAFRACKLVICDEHRRNQPGKGIGQRDKTQLES